MKYAVCFGNMYEFTNSSWIAYNREMIRKGHCPVTAYATDRGICHNITDWNSALAKQELTELNSGKIR